VEFNDVLKVIEKKYQKRLQTTNLNDIKRIKNTKSKEFISLAPKMKNH